MLGAADAATLAVEGADRSVILHRDDGGRPELPAPSGCGPSAVGSGLIAWDCPPYASGSLAQASSVVLTDLAGVEQGRATVPRGTNRSGALAVGAQWVAYLDVPEKWAVRFWINWHTGEQKTYDVTQTAIRADLDAPGLLAPYCPGVRADAIVNSGSGDTTQPGTRPVQFRPPWAIVDVRPGGMTPATRCSTASCAAATAEQSRCPSR
ncbi:hypothetical protein LRS13_07010 [Svornostia abyssi]|uniref:Uncharacterized protein n=1 Tax=Svornostia abyssi TaxID=2898438 RepID=A0ABY5PL34_9ACTN|nr:hypothetical protein LRS13_07010 [Parviterribacteraceae bacterium J379]